MTLPREWPGEAFGEEWLRAGAASGVHREAVRDNAPQIIAVHNHPWGDPTPSSDDAAVTSDLARAGKASREELSGSTVTVSSLGPLGGIAATPIVKPPEVAIVGVNRIVERPVVRDGQIVIRKMMNLSSSFDHRVVDGFDAASFIQTVKGYLETPARLFMEA